MKIIKRLYNLVKSLLFNTSIKPYKWTVIDMDYSDITIGFNDGTVDYILELDWEDGIIDIEFSVKGAMFHDTTNLHNQYKILTTVAYATRRITDSITNSTGYQFHSISFKSSEYRNGIVDPRSMEVRNKFFIKYVLRQFPNACVTVSENNSLLIKLNR